MPIKYLHYLIIFTIAMIVLPLLIKMINRIIEEVKENKKVDIYQLDINSDEFMKAFRKVSYFYTEQEYKRFGKPIYTQKGEYRANFRNDAVKYQKDLMNECLDGNTISTGFLQFLEYVPDLRYKDLASLIADYSYQRKELMEKNFDGFLNQKNTITPEEFFRIKPRIKGDAVGVYIIHNQTKGKYYVGQATRLFFRINQHFTGSGNGDVYADYKYGDDFAISIIKLSESGYSDLDKLERDMIAKYDAYNSGYNKTSGNQ